MRAKSLCGCNKWAYHVKRQIFNKVNQLLHLPQPANPVSSEWSKQSISPSHLQLLGIQAPFLQANLLDGHWGVGEIETLTRTQRKKRYSTTSISSTTWLRYFVTETNRVLWLVWILCCHQQHHQQFVTTTTTTTTTTTLFFSLQRALLTVRFKFRKSCSN